MATNSDKVDFSRLRYEIKKHWYYFAVSFVVMMAMAIAYMLKNNPEFKFHADIMVEQEKNSGMSGSMVSMMKQFSIGGFGGGSVDDELVVLQSHSLLCEAINKLGLQYTYRDASRIRKPSLYRKSPVELSTAIDLDTLQGGATFNIKLRSDNKIDVKVKGKFFSSLFDKKGLTLPATVKLPDGTFTISRTAFYKAGQERNVEVEVLGTQKACEDLAKIYYAEVPSMKANDITLVYQDEDKQRGKDLLNMLIELFNARRLGEEQAKANREIAFIDTRLATISSELSSSEKQLEDFKTANDVTDIAAEAKVLLEQTSKNKASIVGLQTQLSIFDMICEFLDDPKNRYSMIPVTSGQDYESAAKSIESYNQLILERTKLDMSAKPDNKALQALNKQIDGMRAGVIETMRKARESAEIAYNDFVREDGKYATRLRQLPSHERQYVDLYRDTEIKNNLYVFLLEQRESNVLKFSSKEVARIIDHAYFDVKKVWPKGSIVFGAALILSIMIPLIILAIRAIRTKRLRIVEDLEKVTDIEVLGGISAEDKDTDYRRIRDRLISATDAKVVSLASLKGEATTAAIAANLAKSLNKALKRVAVIDLGGNHEVARALGINSDLSLADCVFGNATIGSTDSIDVVSASNASDIDLLASDKVKEMVDGLKQSHDAVIIAGDSFGDYSALSTASSLSDRIIGCVSAGNLREDFEKFDHDLHNLNTACGYLFVK